MKKIKSKFENTLKALKNDGINLNLKNIVCVVFYGKKRYYPKKSKGIFIKMNINVFGTSFPIFELQNYKPLCTLPIFE